MRYIGIDPGKTGAIAVLNASGGIIDVTKMPADLRGLFDFIEMYSDESRAALEFVRTSPAMGVVSAGTFMRNYGHCEMALVAARVGYYDVHPSRWQRYLDCLTKGDKNITKARAAALWPARKVTHAIADALLIAEWCRRKHVGLIVEQSDTSETEG
jgi:hypothetical protein